MFLTLTGFRYRGLSPHKFTPVPGVHKGNTADRYAPADFFIMQGKKKGMHQ
jgi:hypothetical protein